MDVSVILVNYNTLSLTMSCIDSIFMHTQDIDFEVIVVDNDSYDGSQDILSADSRILFIESGSNLGFGRANNLGMLKATGKYIFFLNTDTLLFNNSLKIFYDFAETCFGHIKLGGIGCQLIDGDHNVTHSYSHFPKVNESFINEIRDHWRFLTGQKKPRRVNRYKDCPFGFYEVDYVTGADLFVKRSVLDEVGAFDPDFFMYYEETEMQYRWWRKGYKQLIIEGPEIMHLERKSTVNALNISCEMRDLHSRILYFKKTSHPLVYVYYRMMFVLFRLLYIIMPSISFVDKISFFRLILS